MSKPTLEFFFDCSSPWTYLAFEGIQAIAAEFDVPIDWRPVLVGGIFNAINPTVYANRETPVPQKAAYLAKDLADWARLTGLSIQFPHSIFPVNSVKVMRGCIFLQPTGRLVDFARAAFQAYWSRGQDISQSSVIADLCQTIGVNGDELLAGIESAAIKAALRGNTEEAMRRGAFGSPTIFVNRQDMYFGNDRLPLVRHALTASRL